MENRGQNPSIMILAGEPSGDARGAELARELKKRLKGVPLWGFGGDLMSKEGVEIVRHIRDLSMVGAVEILHKLPDIFRHYRQITRLVREREPRLAVLIDYPGFNLRVARYLHSVSVPVVYYIIPQVWAWGKNRIKKLKKYVTKAIVLFPFEDKLLKDNGIDSFFAGHPLADSFPEDPREKPSGTVSSTVKVALLPGSRKHEINSMLPVMLEAADRINETLGKTVFTLAESPNIDRALYDNMLSSHPALETERFRGDTRAALKEADVAIITSGTATLEGAMMVKPMVIVYKASRLTYLLYLLLSRVPFLGLANIIAGKKIVPELLQDALTPENLSKEVIDIVKTPARALKMKEDLEKVRLSLGKKGAAERAAEEISGLYKNLYGHSD